MEISVEWKNQFGTTTPPPPACSLVHYPALDWAAVIGAVHAAITRLARILAVTAIKTCAWY